VFEEKENSMAEKGKEASDEKTKKKGLPIKTIAIGLVIGLLAGGGAVFFLKGGAPPKQEAGAEAEASVEENVVEEEVEAAPAKPESKESIIYDLEPFIVNLADTPDLRYLKLTLKLDLLRQEDVEEVTKKVPQIRNALLILLSSKDSESIRSIEGKMELRSEILERINGVFEVSRVRTAYFTDFVTQ